MKNCYQKAASMMAADSEEWQLRPRKLWGFWAGCDRGLRGSGSDPIYLSGTQPEQDVPCTARSPAVLARGSSPGCNPPAAGGWLAARRSPAEHGVRAEASEPRLLLSSFSSPLPPRGSARPGAPRGPITSSESMAATPTGKGRGAAGPSGSPGAPPRPHSSSRPGAFTFPSAARPRPAPVLGGRSSVPRRPSLGLPQAGQSRITELLARFPEQLLRCCLAKK